MGELFSAIPTADFAVGRAWWERFFDRPPDLVPNDNEACRRVTGNGWIYVIGDAERAGRASRRCSSTTSTPGSSGSG